MESMNRRELLVAGGLGLAGCAIPKSGRGTTLERAVARLKASVSGPVLVAGDELYDASRRVQSHNPLTDKRPAVIVGPRNAQDVARAIRFARDLDMQLAVQSGGHDVLGQSTVDGGVLIHNGLMSEIRVDGGSVQVRPGARAGQVNTTLGRRGLAVPLGCHPNVGVAGLTLGGGLGWLLGAHGLTCDHVRAFEVVTADGEVRIASATRNPDLNFALRGGGGNFGVVTDMEFDALELKRVARGFLIYRGDQLADFMQILEDFTASAPRELVVETVLVAGADPIIGVTYCHASAEGFRRSLLGRLVEFGPPLGEHHDVVPYPDVASVPEHLVRRFLTPAAAGSPTTGPPGNHWRGRSCAAWTETAVDELVAAFRSAPDGATVGIGHRIHGAALEIDPQEAAFPRVPGSWSFFFNTSWSDPAAMSRHMQWVDRSAARMDPYCIPTYVNYLSSGDPGAVASTYGPSFGRLRAVKAAYDPDNVFRLNRNIPPAVTP